MKKKHPFCTTCKNHHPQHDDGFEYLDCMLYMKKRDGKKKSNTDNSGWSFNFNHSFTEPSSFHCFEETTLPSL